MYPSIVVVFSFRCWWITTPRRKRPLSLHLHLRCQFFTLPIYVLLCKPKVLISGLLRIPWTPLCQKNWLGHQVMYTIYLFYFFKTQLMSLWHMQTKFHMQTILRKYTYLPHTRDFLESPPSPRLWKFQLTHRGLTEALPPPCPPGKFHFLLWGEHMLFLELHIMQCAGQF